MRVATRLVLAGLVAAAVHGPVLAEPYRDAAHKFAVDLPAGWEVLPPTDLARINAARRPGDPFHAIAAFRPAGTVGDPTRGKHPLVLVAALPSPHPDVTFAEFERAMTRAFTTRDAHGRTNLRGPLAFDEPRKRMVVQFTEGEIGGYAAAFYGKDEFILVHGLSEVRAFKGHVPTFERLADSFRFEDPSAPPLGPPPPYLDRVLNTNLGPHGQTVAVGVAVAALVLVVGTLFRRGRRF